MDNGWNYGGTEEMNEKREGQNMTTLEEILREVVIGQISLMIPHMRTSAWIEWEDERTPVLTIVPLTNAILAAVMKEVRLLDRLLNCNTCNSGHTGLPVYLWDCPTCRDEREARLRVRIEALEYAIRRHKASFDNCPEEAHSEEHELWKVLGDKTHIHYAQHKDAT